MSTALESTALESPVTPLGPVGALRILVLRNFITYRHAW